MRYEKLGQSGFEASVIGLGAWAIGGAMWGGTDPADAIAAIHASIDAGINFIDTAPAYGAGASEEMVGKAIAGRRDKVLIATKCGLVWDREQGELFAEREGVRVYKCLRPDSLRAEVERSLRRLGVDAIDLYQTHWQEPTTPIADTMGTLMALKQEGKIRAIGVCNASPAQMDAYRAVGPLDTDQESYNMIDRGIESAQLPYSREHGIAVLAYSPMARGLLTGKITPERVFGPGDHRADRPLFAVENRKRVAALLERCRPVAEAHGITFAQLAVAWTLAQPGITHALVGARNAAQAAENVKAAEVVLSADELGMIDQALAGYTPA